MRVRQQGILLTLISAISLSSISAFSPSNLKRKSHRSLAIKATLDTEETKNNADTFYATAVPGPPEETKPNYENIVGPLGKPMDYLFMTVFRSKLAEAVGKDSSRPITDFGGIIDLASDMNRRLDQKEVHERAQTVLRSLFPSWMPGSYAKLFSKPFPAFSSRMNAWATKVAGTWLMGECEVNDVPVDGGEMGKSQGLLVKRCRFLEESGCASVCVNSCKIPTQNFFMQDMGLPLTMEPNYETFECQFSFGKTPTLETELEAKNTPCLMRCPTVGSLRKLHNGEITSNEVVEAQPCEKMGFDEE